MRGLEGEGSEIGVHGSYTSLDEPDGLAAEFGRFREQGFEPAGTRQHWLRFTLDRLIPEVEKCGALYDSSLGWADRIGFRAGACFAYPPYDFEHERPAGFLEIPLIVMDQALLSMNGASELLAVSRKYGWGGVSFLWHPTAFGGGQLPQEIGRAFWKLLDENCSDSTWVSAETFVRCVRRHYEAVGLLCA
jgi:hypothetical protein